MNLCPYSYLHRHLVGRVSNELFELVGLQECNVLLEFHGQLAWQFPALLLSSGDLRTLDVCM